METVQVLGILFLVIITQTNAGYFKDCGSKVGKILSVSVSGCKPDADQCQLKKGSTIHVEVEFKAGELITNATAVVHGILAGIPVSFPLPQHDGCESGFTCPVKDGAVVTYKSNIEVSKSYPDVKVVVKWELKDKNGDDIFCALFKSEIVS